MIVRKLLKALDGPGLRCWLAGRYGYEFPEDVVNKWMKKSYIVTYEDDDTWAMWFANRICEDGFGFIFEGKKQYPAGVEDWVNNKLHIFFLHLEETTEMLLRLANKDTSEKTPTGPSTPGIEKTEVKVQPIDKTAARVVGLHREDT